MTEGQEVAFELCKKLYKKLSPEVYPALTGGTLYKDGDRKDIDIVLYFNRDSGPMETEDLKKKLNAVGLRGLQFKTGFVAKAKYKGYSIDLLNPETDLDADGY